jgi:hypothetical protein
MYFIFLFAFYIWDIAMLLFKYIINYNKILQAGMIRFSERGIAIDDLHRLNTSKIDSINFI